MRKLALLLSLVFAAGVALAQEKPAAEAPKAEKAKAAAVAKHDVDAEIVAVDTAKNTLTIKGEKENLTVPVEGKAIAALKNVKAGEKVTLTCKDDEKGAHKSVVDIKLKAAAEKPQ